MLGIRRMDRVLNAQIRELCRVMKRLHKRIDEVILQWFGLGEKMQKNRIAKRIYV